MDRLNEEIDFIRDELERTAVAQDLPTSAGNDLLYLHVCAAVAQVEATRELNATLTHVKDALQELAFHASPSSLTGP